MPTLEDAISQLYEAFADVPKPMDIDACPCCVDSKNLCTLTSLPLRDIPADDLGPYAASAFLTVGDVPDYLYFLPRILECSARLEFWWPDPEVTGRAIANTHPAEWPAPRRAAFHQFLSSQVSHLLEQADSGSELDSWLCAIARMGLDVRPFLSQIEPSLPHVLSFYEANANQLTERKLANAFWELPNEGHDQILAWFGSEPVSDIILQAYGVALYHDCK
ncbi:MAG: hypothetical protein V4599_04420 [Verrucomicrobiota bacterium]